MVNFKKLQKQCPDGIPFSKCKGYLKKQKKTQKHKKKISRKFTRKIPPRGVIIRKKNKYYKSDGKSLKLINLNSFIDK